MACFDAGGLFTVKADIRNHQAVHDQPFYGYPGSGGIGCLFFDHRARYLAESAARARISTYNEGLLFHMFNLLEKKKMQELSLELIAKLKADIKSPKAKVRYLSGGQRAAAAIASCLTFTPKLVIMDEPTAALAVKEVNEVLNLILELKSQGISIIIISHRLQDIFAIGDRIMVLRQGQKVGDVKKEDTSSDEIVSLIVGADLADEQRKEIIAGR